MKNLRNFVFIFVFISFNLFACSSGSSSNFEGGEAATEVMDANMPSPPPALSALSEYKDEEVAEASEVALNYHTTESEPDATATDLSKQIIKTAQVKIQVEKLKESKALVTKLVNSYGGYLATSNEARSSGDYTATFSIRVPAAKFEGLLDELLKPAVFVAYNNVSAQDVTEEFVDIQTRLKTKRALEARYLDLLKQARSMEDILKLEAALQQIREDIESREGRLKYLQSQVGYSTINLEMYEQVPYNSAPDLGFFSKLASGFGEGWELFLGFSIGMITLWPFWLVLAACIWLIRRWLKKRRLRKAMVAQ